MATLVQEMVALALDPCPPTALDYLGALLDCIGDLAWNPHYIELQILARHLPKLHAAAKAPVDLVLWIKDLFYKIDSGRAYKDLGQVWWDLLMVTSDLTADEEMTIDRLKRAAYQAYWYAGDWTDIMGGAMLEQCAVDTGDVVAEMQQAVRVATGIVNRSCANIPATTQAPFPYVLEAREMLAKIKDKTPSMAALLCDSTRGGMMWSMLRGDGPPSVLLGVHGDYYAGFDQDADLYPVLLLAVQPGGAVTLIAISSPGWRPSYEDRLREGLGLGDRPLHVLNLEE